MGKYSENGRKQTHFQKPGTLMGYFGFTSTVQYFGVVICPQTFSPCAGSPPLHILTVITECECPLNRFCDLQICPPNNVYSSVGLECGENVMSQVPRLMS